MDRFPLVFRTIGLPQCPCPAPSSSLAPASFRWRGPVAEKGGGNNRTTTGNCQRSGKAAAYRPTAPPSEILSEPPHPGVGRLLLIKPEP